MRHALTLSVSALILLAIALPATAQEAENYLDKIPHDIEVAKLAPLLGPLTQADLVALADRWRHAAAGAGLAAGLGEEGAQERQEAHLERLEIVVGALEAKGGDVAEYKAYLKVAAPGVDIGVDKLNAESASKLWKKVREWLTSSDGGIKVGTSIVLFILTLIVFKILANILGGITRKAVGTMKKSSSLLKDFFVNVVKKITFFIGLVVALSMIGVNVGPFVAAIGAVGFIIGFALQGTLSNFASGIMILLYRPYDIGDVVSAGGTTGKVESMSLVSTTFKTPDNQIVVVPNGSIWGGIITNITGSDTRRVDLVAGIGYGDDIAKAQQVLEGILDSHELILKDPAPVVKLHELADSSVNFVVRPWCRTSDYWTVYWDVTRAIKERFDAEGISIPFPQQDVWMHQVTE